MLSPATKRDGPTKVSVHAHQIPVCIYRLYFAVYAASAIPFVPEVYPDPQEATEEYIKTVIDAFVAAAKRAEKAGCKLMHSSFPLTC